MHTYFRLNFIQVVVRADARPVATRWITFSRPIHGKGAYMASILNDAFFDSLASSAIDLESAESLPPACYTDPEFYKFEREAIFAREWLCVGREEWVREAGDYFTTTLADEPILVSRTRDMELKAMSSVCQHRAMLVAEGNGNTRGVGF